KGRVASSRCCHRSRRREAHAERRPCTSSRLCPSLAARGLRSTSSGTVTVASGHDRIDAIQAAWRRARPDIDLSSLAILTLALLIGRHLTREGGRALSELGADTSTLDVLATLRRAGAPYRLRTSAIEAASQVTAGAVTRRLDRLQARGLVSR